MAVVSGGTTLIDNGALDAGVPTGSLILLSTQTASASASLEFSMDSSYDSYIFKFINCHPSTSAELRMNGSIDNGSNYNVTKTTTFIEYYHYENDSATGLAYNTVYDSAQSTADAYIISGTSTANDEALSGTLQIFNPSSDTFVKHFLSTINTTNSSATGGGMVGGYFNTTSPVTNLKFQFVSGNIDDGIIKMYGVK